MSAIPEFDAMAEAGELKMTAPGYFKRYLLYINAVVVRMPWSS